MKNEKSGFDVIPKKYLSFELFYKRKILALLNIDEEECTLYDKSGDAFLNSYLKSFSDSKLKLKLKKDAGNWQLISNREVFVNGVAWRKRILKDYDKIHLGEYRLKFKGNFIEDLPIEPVPLISAKRKRIFRILEVAAVVMSISFLWYCTTINQNKDIRITENELSPIGHESELPYTYSEELDSVEDYPYYPGPDDDPVHTPLIVYSPDEEPVPQKLDILFIHAHPDDESLDYGLYMAEAAEAGKSTGIIVFTDGDSGFDKYPDRPVDGIYIDTYLKGPELASVRIQEAQRALTVLGARVYLRLGLWNRAYTSVEVSKSIGTLISEWGGQDQLVNNLVHLIEIFQPDVIVSPDGPTCAREHFEHEAVGLISELAVNSYRERNPGSLKAYLQLIDVQQIEAYPGVNLLEIDSGEDNKYKDLKYTALMMHQTQADASFFGIKRLEEFPVEYYMARYCSEKPVDTTLAFLDNKMVETLSE